MKVVFVSTTFLAKNGISTFVLNNSNYFASKLNIETYIVAPNLVDKYTKKLLRENKVHLIEIPFRKKNPLKYLKKLMIFLKSDKFDAIHVNGNSSTMGLELFLVKLAKIPVRISHCHNTKSSYPKLNKILKPLFNYCVNCRMACSQEAGEWLYGKRNFYVIDNGINLDTYCPSECSRKRIREIFNLTSSTFTLINVGYFNYQKNQSFLIDVIQKMPANYKLILVGEGTNLLATEKMVEQKKLKDKVIFAGSVNNVNEYLAGADAFLLPSRYEGFPFSLVEAQASGLPCVVSDNVTKRVNLTGNVIFCSIENANEWAEEILKLKKLKFNDRLIKVRKNDLLIDRKGFNITTNAEMLNNIIKEKLSV